MMSATSSGSTDGARRLPEQPRCRRPTPAAEERRPADRARRACRRARPRSSRRAGSGSVLAAFAASRRSRCRGSRSRSKSASAPLRRITYARLSPLEAGVERHEHAAGRLDAERGDDPLPDVRGPHGDAVAGLDSRGRERARRLQHVVGELSEGAPHAGVHVDDGVGLRPPLGRGLNEPGDRLKLQVTAQGLAVVTARRLPRAARQTRTSRGSVVPARV